MHSPTFNDLPFPPPQKTGWPWSCDFMPPPLAKSISTPCISIITPSYNQAQYLEETIRSVLLQGYQNYEYFIFDGGSSDGSIEIIRKYEPWITYWESQKDNGQAHAINKGLKLFNGDLVGWINSDDLLLPGAFQALGEAYAQGNHILLGDVINFIDGTVIEWPIDSSRVSFSGMMLQPFSGTVWHQPSVYVTSELVHKIGLLDENLRYLFDMDWMLRLLQTTEVSYLHKKIARFRMHPHSKTVAEILNWPREIETVVSRYEHLMPANKLNLLHSSLDLHKAVIFLSCDNFNRQLGWLHLLNSFVKEPRIALSKVYTYTLLRSLLPLNMLMLAKRVQNLIHTRNHSLWPH